MQEHCQNSTRRRAFCCDAKLVCLVPECFSSLSFLSECFVQWFTLSWEHWTTSVQVDLWRKQRVCRYQPKGDLYSGCTRKSWPLRTENAEFGGREGSLWHFFGYLEVSDTQTDLRNVFFSKFWVYDRKGLVIFAFMKNISNLAKRCYPCWPLSRDLLKNSSGCAFKSAFH